MQCDMLEAGNRNWKCRSSPRRLRLAFCAERVLPPHPGKTREIAVRRTKDQSVLDGKCGKMGVLDKIRVYSRRGEEFSDYLAMALGGLRNPYSLGGEPGEHLPPRFGDGCGPFEYAWIGGQSQECEQTGPRQADGRDSIQAGIKPCAGVLVLGEGADVGIDQQIRIDQYHG